MDTTQFSSPVETIEEKLLFSTWLMVRSPHHPNSPIASGGDMESLQEITYMHTSVRLTQYGDTILIGARDSLSEPDDYYPDQPVELSLQFYPPGLDLPTPRGVVRVNFLYV